MKIFNWTGWSDQLSNWWHLYSCITFCGVASWGWGGGFQFSLKKTIFVLCILESIGISLALCRKSYRYINWWEHCCHKSKHLPWLVPLPTCDTMRIRYPKCLESKNETATKWLDRNFIHWYVIALILFIGHDNHQLHADHTSGHETFSYRKILKMIQVSPNCER